MHYDNTLFCIGSGCHCLKVDTEICINIICLATEKFLCLLQTKFSQYLCVPYKMVMVLEDVTTDSIILVLIISVHFFIDANCLRLIESGVVPHLIKLTQLPLPDQVGITIAEKFYGVCCCSKWQRCITLH